MPILPRVERPDVLVDQLGGGAEHDRVHGADVHHVAHRRGGAAVAGDRLADHRVGDVVLAQAAVLLRHREPQEPVLAEELQVAAREHAARRRSAWRSRGAPSRRARSGWRGAPSAGRCRPSPGPSRTRVPRRARNPTSCRSSLLLACSPERVGAHARPGSRNRTTRARNGRGAARPPLSSIDGRRSGSSSARPPPGAAASAPRSASSGRPGPGT